MFYVKVTTAGTAKLAAAVASQTPIQITQFAVGDANGAYYEPTGNEVALVHEVWRAAPNRVYTHPNNANWIVVEAIIPASQGGFDVREAAVFAADGAMVAIGKYPLTNKPAPGSGSEKDLYVRLIMQVTSAASVEQLIDPSLIMATQEYVDRKNVREACRVATTANVVLSGLQTIDGVVLSENDRVLVKSQNTGAQNGIYVAKAAAWTRALDADNALEIVDTMLVPVREGTVNGDTIWMLATDGPITVGSSVLAFIRIFPDESSRTVSDATAPTGDTGSPSTIFGWLANMIKAITGKANWRTAPATTLEAAKAHIDASAPHAGHVNHSLATAANDFLVGAGAGSFIKKTLAEVKTILGLGDAAYKNTGTAAGTVAAGNHAHTGVYEPADADIQAHIVASAPHAGHVNHSLATAANDFLVASAAGSFIKKTLAEVKTILGLGAAAYMNTGTAAGTVAVGNHAHTGVYEPADADIQAHLVASAPHAGHVNHSLATAANDFLVASAAGSFIKKTLAEVKAILGLGTAAYMNTGTAAGTVAVGNHAHAGVYEPANANIQAHVSASAPHAGHALLNHSHTAGQMPSGAMVGYARASRSDRVVCSGTIPKDGTVPLSTEGSEILTISYTPKLTTSKLLVSATLTYSKQVHASQALVLFKGATAVAGAVMCDSDSGQSGSYSTQGTATLVHEFSPGSTATVTLSVRGETGFYINGNTANQSLGGIESSYITVQEIA
jgi:hypothetical protein